MKEIRLCGEHEISFVTQLFKLRANLFIYIRRRQIVPLHLIIVQSFFHKVISYLKTSTCVLLRRYRVH